MSPQDMHSMLTKSGIDLNFLNGNPIIDGVVINLAERNNLLANAFSAREGASLSDKQMILDSISFSKKEEFKKGNQRLPEIFVPWIDDIDSITSKTSPDHFGQRHIMKTYGPNAFKGSIETKKITPNRSSSSPENKEFVKKLIKVYQITHYLGYSVGITLLRILSKVLVEEISDHCESFQASSYRMRGGKKVYINETTPPLAILCKTSLLMTVSILFLEHFLMLQKSIKKALLLKKDSGDCLSDIENLLLSYTECEDDWWVPNETDCALFCQQLALYFDLADFFVSYQKTKIGGESLQNQTTVYAIYNILFISGLFSLQRDTFGLPLLTPANNWVFSELDKRALKYPSDVSSLHSGGPSLVSSKQHSAFIKTHHTHYAFASKLDADFLNYLQGVAFTINKDFLKVIIDDLQANLIFCLYDIDIAGKAFSRADLDSILKETAFFFFSCPEKPHSLKLKTIDEFVNSSETVRNLNAQLHDEHLFLNEDEKLKLNLRISRLKSLLHSRYLCTVESIYTFVYTLMIGFYYKENDLYFCHLFDFRGRHYSPAFPVSPQGFNLGASLLEFREEENTPINPIDLSYFRKSLKNDKKDFFTKKKIISKTNKGILKLDVTCSGLQILFGLTGFKEGLIETNFIQSIKEESKKKNLFFNIKKNFFDSYPVNISFTDSNVEYQSSLFVGNGYSLDFEDSLLFPFQKSLIKSKPLIRSLNLLTSKFATNEIFTEDQNKVYSARYKPGNNVVNDKAILDFCTKHESFIPDLFLAFKIFIDEDLIKRWSIRLMYGQSSILIALDLIYLFKENASLFPYCSQSFFKLLLHKIVVLLAYKFKKVFFDMFKSLNDFRLFIVENVTSKQNLSIHKGVWLSSRDDYLSVFYGQFKPTVKRCYHTGLDNVVVEFSYNINSSSIDKKKHRRSIIPNYVHYLNSRLLVNVVLLCKESKIPLFVRHDCLFVHHAHASKIKKIYFDCFKSLIINDDCVKHFLISNNLDPDDFEAFKKLNDSRLLILNTLNIECEFEQSPFILT
jgi:hypothetical protein